MQRDICANRHQGDLFSRLAFAESRDRMPEKRRKVLDFIQGRGSTGATADEVAAAFGVGINCISGRLSELKRDGLIGLVGERPTRTGKASGVYAALNDDA